MNLNDNKLTINIPNGEISSRNSIHFLSMVFTVHLANYWERMIDKILYVRYGWQVKMLLTIEATISIGGTENNVTLFHDSVTPRSFFYVLRNSERKLNDYLNNIECLDDLDIKKEIHKFVFNFEIID